MDKDEKDKSKGVETEEEKKERIKENRLHAKEKKEFLETAMKRYERENKKDKSNREKASDDQKFLNLDQWSTDDLETRKQLKRPALVFDELNRPVNQIIGEMRMNKAHIKVIPSDVEGSAAVAKARQEIIHAIEYDSEADSIYDYAGESMAGCGYGAWRICTRYCASNPFVEEIYMERIKNPLLVFMDSSAKSQVYSDSKYGFVLEHVTKDEFEERYPKKKLPAIEDFKTHPGNVNELWFDEDGFWIADYYLVEEEETKFVLMEDDEVMTKDEYKEELDNWEEEQKEMVQKAYQEAMVGYQKAIMQQGQQMGQMQQPPGQSPQQLPNQPGQPTPQGAMPQQPGQAMPPQGMPQQAMPPQLPPPPNPPDPNLLPPLPDRLIIAKEATKVVPKIKHYAIAPGEILDGPNDVPGHYVPVIMVRGPEKNVDGNQIVTSAIRKGKDPQRALNVTETSKAEIIGMIPHAPWIATAEQIQPYDKFYQASNVQNYPWLPYKPHVITDDNGQSHLVPKPERVSIGQTPTAMFQFSNDIKGYIEDAVGIARADTMATDDPSRTGAAVRGKRRPSDVGTFPYIDNLHRGIVHCGRIINSMIPEVYDSSRDVRVMVGEEEETISHMPINTPSVDAMKKVQGNPEHYQGVDIDELTKLAKEKPKDMYNDIGKGEYDVMIKVGPPFSTAREEASEQMIQVAVQGQKMSPIDKYFVVKNLNLSDGGEYADALRGMIPPHILPPKEGDKPRPKQPIPPQMQLVMAKSETEKLKQQATILKTKESLMKIAKESKNKDDEIYRIALRALSDVFTPDQRGE